MNLLAQNAWAGIDVGRDLLLFSPLLALICTMLAVVACPIVVGRRTTTVAGVAVVGLVITFVLALRVMSEVADAGVSGLSTAAGSGILIADNLSIIFQVILLVFMGGVLLLWWIGSAEKERDAPEFFILLIGSALGMALMVSTTHLLMIIIAIEMASIPSYAMVGFDKRDPRGAEASLKYMIFGAISAAIMLYGASLLYGTCGSLDIATIAQQTVAKLGPGPLPVLQSVGLLCFLGGIAFKISAVPFHFWCPDAFQGAKIEVTTWLSVASKAAGLLLLGRLVLAFATAQADISGVHGMGSLAPLWWSIGIMACVTCTVGNFAAYRQTSVKRLLAYSSIAHAGYMMMATAVFLHPDIAGGTAGISALLLYIITYMFMNLGAFGVVAMVSWDTGSDHIDSFTGLIRRAPWLAVPMVICLVSLVGLPPFAGFIAKWWVLVALGKMSEMGAAAGNFGYFLIVVIAINTLISLFYYMRIVVQMTIRDDKQEPVESSVGGLAMVNVCAAMLFALFIFAQPIKNTTDRFSQNLFQPAVEQVHADEDGHDRGPALAAGFETHE